MSKTIWFWNHYATEMFFQQGGRHHWFAKYLKRMDYKVKIFCASTQHGRDDDIQLEGALYKEDISEDIDYVFVKVRAYKGNGISRILNMMSFYHNVQKAAKKIAQRDGVPDVILASSVHPLTLIAGIRFGKKYKIPCICEVRDLWPESIVAYSEKLSKKNLFVKFLYRGERWIYERADALIFTMEGGKDYIIEQGWDQVSGGKIDLNKVHYINNGVDLESYYHNLQQYDYPDPDLDNTSLFKVVYTGSIRRVNNLNPLVSVAEKLMELGSRDIRILIFGDGNQKTEIEECCKKKGLTNIVFKGHLEEKYIPAILSKSSIVILHGSHQTEKVTKYGLSPNKLFKYFAAGKPVLSDIRVSQKYDLIRANEAGRTIIDYSTQGICEGISYFETLREDAYERYCSNSLHVAEQFDFKYLTEVLKEIIENTAN
ncbi:PEP-CTERM/exosortase A-associated glycosyltransferase%2C Daro_2409 family [uncultured Eubacterium sp.]|nr:PEP-CTERM/exosortase A-associated glycosyltransferase%2C Daro_2409 family [uncultured Eubacterium sp.]